MLIAVSGASANETEGQEESIGDLDPTRPVFFNVREEFYNLEGDAWRNALILRTDVVKLGGLRNFLLRFDVPLMAVDLGMGTDYGLGDLYGQLLLVPYRRDNFFSLSGPASQPPPLRKTPWEVENGRYLRWPFPFGGSRTREAFFFVKVQDYISFAGKEDRADIHYMTVTPFLAMKIGERWWVGADTEAKFNWEQDNLRSYKSGVIILRRWTKGFGTWIKPEIPWGPNREGDFTIKCFVFLELLILRYRNKLSRV